MIHPAALLVFLLSGCLILYVLIGYPLVLAGMARSKREVHRAPIQPFVTILLPVYNGERWLSAKLDSILALDYPRNLVQVIVLCDGSTDHTADVASGFADRGIDLVRLPRGGKAAALNAGLERARGDILFLTDVRQPLKSDCLRELIACFADPDVGAASGELMILAGDNVEQANVGLYWHYEKWLRRRLSQIDSVLGATGAVYAIRRELVRPMPPGILLDDVYWPLCAFFAGRRVIFEEKAIAYDYPTSLHTEFQRKVRTQAGVYQLVQLFPQLITPAANRMWFHFMSHKLGRLTVPFAMIAMAVSSFWLPGILAALAIGGQAAFYALAGVDTVLPDRVPLKRLTSPIRTYVVLMAAALCATSVMFRPPQDFWKSATGNTTG